MRGMFHVVWVVRFGCCGLNVAAAHILACGTRAVAGCGTFEVVWVVLFICVAAVHILAAELMTWSMACIEKLKVMNSTIGRSCWYAAPVASPAKPASVIGVSITRFSPNSSSKPFVICKGKGCGER